MRRMCNNEFYQDEDAPKLYIEEIKIKSGLNFFFDQLKFLIICFMNCVLKPEIPITKSETANPQFPIPNSQPH